jgi:hypothetical protein
MYILFVLNAMRPCLGEFYALDSPAPEKRRLLATLLPTCRCLHEHAVTCALMWLFGIDEVIRSCWGSRRSEGAVLFGIEEIHFIGDYS